MERIEITEMIIDDYRVGEEYVTADFMYNEKKYRVTLDKSDQELVNLWVFEDGMSLPATLSDDLIEPIREEIKKRM